MSTKTPPKILDERLVHDGFSRFRIVRLQTADGTILHREIEDHGFAVAVLPYDPDRRVALMVQQMRPPLLVSGGPDLLTEVPAGLMEEGEDPAESARREAEEETGVHLRSLQPLGRTWPMPGISTEMIHLFLATYGVSDRVSAGGGVADEHEDITVLEIPLATLAAQADAGELPDLKTHLLVNALRLRRPELFAA